MPLFKGSKIKKADEEFTQANTLYETQQYWKPSAFLLNFFYLH